MPNEQSSKSMTNSIVDVLYQETFHSIQSDAPKRSRSFLPFKAASSKKEIPHPIALDQIDSYRHETDTSSSQKDDYIYFYDDEKYQPEMNDICKKQHKTSPAGNHNLLSMQIEQEIDPLAGMKVHPLIIKAAQPKMNNDPLESDTNTLDVALNCYHKSEHLADIEPYFALLYIIILYYNITESAIIHLEPLWHALWNLFQMYLSHSQPLPTIYIDLDKLNQIINSRKSSVLNIAFQVFNKTGYYHPKYTQPPSIQSISDIMPFQFDVRQYTNSLPPTDSDIPESSTSRPIILAVVGLVAVVGLGIIGAMQPKYTINW